MKRAIAWLGMALLVVGCGKSENTPLTQNKPDEGQAKASISTYLNDCGWKEIEFVSFQEASELPREVKGTKHSCAFQFSAKYTNLFGERVAKNNWVAVVCSDTDKPVVTYCYDDAMKLIGKLDRANEDAKVQEASPIRTVSFTEPANLAPNSADIKPLVP
jgi:hypothetical protein